MKDHVRKTQGRSFCSQLCHNNILYSPLFFYFLSHIIVTPTREYQTVNLPRFSRFFLAIGGIMCYDI